MKVKEAITKSIEATKKFSKTPMGKLYIAYIVFEMYAIYTFIKIEKEGKQKRD